MRIHTNEEKKLVTIWLTSEDQSNPACDAFLDPLISVWKAKAYFPVVFRSGIDSLYDNTAGLLLHNRDTVLRKEIESEKAIKHNISAP